MQFSGVIKLEEGLIMAKSPNVTVSFDEKPIFEFKVLKFVSVLCYFCFRLFVCLFVCLSVCVCVCVLV